MKKCRKNALIFFLLGLVFFIFKDDILNGNIIVSKLRDKEQLNFIIMFIAGVIDGINPCALSMLIFFITFSTANASKKTNTFFMGIMFALGTFISYFLAGIGILKVIHLGKYINNFHKIIYFITAMVAFLLAYLSILDAFSAKKYDIGNIRLQLPRKNKEFIHKAIKKFTNFKFKYFISLLLGFVVTISELLCTGQVYLTSMMTIHKLDAMLKSTYLLIFNLGFILPIIIISFIIHKGKEVMDMTDMLYNKLWIIKIITASIMIVFGVISLKKLLSII